MSEKTKQSDLVAKTTDDVPLSTKLDLWLQSGLLPKSIDTKAKAFVVMQTGKELGLEPMASFSNIFVINQKPVLSSDVKLTLIHKRCKSAQIQFTEISNERCELFARRDKELDMVAFEYTIQDAQKAGLLKNKTYEQHPKVMLKNRCVSLMASTLFSDLFTGFAEEDLPELSPEIREVSESNEERSDNV
jgi:hypothetical protein